DGIRDLIVTGVQTCALPIYFQTADALTKVARALVFENKFAEGVPMLERALAIRERVFGPAHPMVASTLNELGNVQMRQDRPGERSEERRVGKECRCWWAAS